MANVIDIIVNASDKASPAIRKIADEIEELGEKGTKFSGITSAISGLIPILGVATAGVTAMAGSLVSAGAGVAGFGAVAIPLLGGVIEKQSEIADLEEKIAQADSAEERAKYQEELALAMEGVSDAQKGAIKDLTDFKAEYMAFAKEFEKPVFKAFGESMDFVMNTLNALKPAITDTANVIVGFMEGLNESFKTDQVKSFFDFFNTYAGSSLQAILTSTSNIFVGFMEVLMAFSPIIDDVNDGLVNATGSFRSWAESLAGSNGFQTFLEYVKTNTPIVLGLFGDLFGVIGDLIVLLAPLGSTVVSMLGQIMEQLNLFGDTFRNAFDTGNFEIVGQQFAMMMMNIVTTILGGLPQVIEAGAQIIASIMAGMASYLPAFILTIVQLLSNVAITIVQQAPTLIASGMQIILALIEGLTLALPQIITTITTIITSVVTTFGTTIATYLPMILQAGLQMLTALVQGIIQALPQIITAVGTLIMTLLTTLQQNLPTIIQQGVQILISLIQGIISILPQLISTALTIITTIVQILLENLPHLIEAGIELLLALVEGLSDTIPQLVPIAVDAVMTLFNTLLDNLPMIIEAGVELLFAVIEGITQVLPQLLVAALEIILTIAGEIIANLPKIIETGLEIIGALIQGIIDAAPDLASTALDSAEQAGQAFLDMDWAGIGMDVVNGIIGGLTSAGGWLVDAATSLAKDAFNGAKNFLGINSPSKLFERGIGRWIPAGMGVGVDKYAHTAIDAVSGVAQGMYDEADGVGKSVEEQLGFGFTGGRSSTRVEVVHRHEGTVDVNGDGGTEAVSMVGESVRTSTEETFLSDIRQAVRSR